jgi:hypothetical protein
MMMFSLSRFTTSLFTSPHRGEVAPQARVTGRITLDSPYAPTSPVFPRERKQASAGGYA